jgi:hypothetical protein
MGNPTVSRAEGGRAEALPHDELLALAALLKEARCIEQDLARRLAQRPRQKSLLKLHKEYRELVERLTRDFESALALYVPRVKAAVKSGPFRTNR